MTPEELTSEKLFELHAAHIASNERLLAAIESVETNLPATITQQVAGIHVPQRTEHIEIPQYPDVRPHISRATRIMVVLSIINLIGLAILYAVK